MERRQTADALLALALRKRQPQARRFADYKLPVALERAVFRHERKLADPYYADALATLAEHRWIRDLESWQPHGKSPRSKLDSLVRHLLVQYDMPKFLFGVFLCTDDHLRGVGIELFVYLGGGGSLFRYVRNGRFPVPLTRRMCHLFMRSPAHMGLLDAVRRAQVSALGGDPRVVSAIATTRQLGRGFTDDEAFWAGVLHWTCNQVDIPPGQLGPIYDWIARLRREDPGFRLKGRTSRSVLRAMAQWHGLLAHEDGDVNRILPSSGYADWQHMQRVKLSGGHWRAKTFTITEIRNTRDLAEEGCALRHCVYGYANAVRRQTTSIWSYKVDGRRALTLEVDHRTRKVVQCRGRANRLPSRSDTAWIERFAASNGLTLHPELPVS